MFTNNGRVKHTACKNIISRVCKLFSKLWPFGKKYKRKSAAVATRTYLNQNITGYYRHRRCNGKWVSMVKVMHRCFTLHAISYSYLTFFVKFISMKYKYLTVNSNTHFTCLR